MATAVADWEKRVAQMGEFVALKLFIDWEVFENIPLQGTISYAELASKLNVEVSLLTRLAWVLVASGVLSQVDEDLVAHTEVSRLYLPGTADRLQFSFGFDIILASGVKMPQFFARHGRKEPQAQNNSPLAFGLGVPEKTPFEIFFENPERMKTFLASMDVTEEPEPISDVYDFSWLADKIHQEPTRTVLVDVGGANGHITKAILRENPWIPPKLVVIQDRKEVVESVAQLQDPALSAVTLQSHDFHLPQPLLGAMIYWIRLCLHDYSDEVSTRILSHLAGALAHDSKILIVEYVLPNPPPLSLAMSDFNMLAINGKERTAKSWSLLVSNAGLKIAKIHGLGRKGFQVIECIKV
ncbi:putative o-methyltransferase [Diaporthe ampelina]|uniref:Putative o-methyltransferase n=1 Tax=Diaporthe ampelina TaxID=1214573 RepID=A0A0G2HM88_9PEZI|nr:putative o-methyltransferase [Diaporthe ampelina]